MKTACPGFVALRNLVNNKTDFGNHTSPQHHRNRNYLDRKITIQYKLRLLLPSTCVWTAVQVPLLFYTAVLQEDELVSLERSDSAATYKMEYADSAFFHHYGEYMKDHKKAQF